MAVPWAARIFMTFDILSGTGSVLEPGSFDPNIAVGRDRRGALGQSCEGILVTSVIVTAGVVEVNPDGPGIGHQGVDQVDAVRRTPAGDEVVAGHGLELLVPLDTGIDCCCRV